jgi:hypothetical protein
LQPDTEDGECDLLFVSPLGWQLCHRS